MNKGFGCCRDSECCLINMCPRKGACGKDKDSCYGNLDK